MKPAIFLFLILTLLSCNKNNEEANIPYSEASYKVIVTTNWTSPAFGVPAGAHFTVLVGMVHILDTSLWVPGKLASPGLENVAETGNTTKMNDQIDAILLKNKALSKFTITPPSITGTVQTDLVFNTNHPFKNFLRKYFYLLLCYPGL